MQLPVLFATPFPSVSTSATLFAALFLLALAPNLGVLVVATRAAAAGFRQGAWAALGIVTATSAHILAAILVLKIVAAMRPEAREVLRLVAAVWLVWSGMVMVRDAQRPPRAALPVTRRDAASFATGFLLTFLNLKSVVLYVCFLPAFVAAGSLNGRGILGVLAVVIAAGFVARLPYAAAAARGRIVPGVLAGRILNVIAGVVVAAAGAALVLGW